MEDERRSGRTKKKKLSTAGESESHVLKKQEKTEQRQDLIESIHLPFTVETLS